MKLYEYIENPMKFATEIARKSSDSEEIPVGCVIVNSKQQLISYSSNLVIKNTDPTAHAEIEAIRKACKIVNNYRLFGMSLYVTLEPCSMCEYAIYQSRIQSVFFGAYNEKFRNSLKKISENYHSNLTKFQYFGGFEEEQNMRILKAYFKKLRN